MLKGVLQFGLTRRPIILLCLLVFVGGGLIAFTKLNIEAYPNPAPVILEITAQANGLLRRGDGAVLHDTDGGRPCRYARGRQHPVDVVLRPLIRARHLQLRRRLLLRAHASGDQSATECQSAGQCCAFNSRLEPGRRNLSLSSDRPAAFWIDQSAHHRGLDRAAPSTDRSRRRSGQHLGRHNKGVRGRGRSAQARRLQHHAAANYQCRRQR